MHRIKIRLQRKGHPRKWGGGHSAGDSCREEGFASELRNGIVSERKKARRPRRGKVFKVLECYV